jgi:hypothetical protein
VRAREFVAEAKVGPVGKRKSVATRGLHIFSKSISSFDRMYDLNRLMMAVASSDGVHPIEMDRESWAGKHNTAHPYTKEEQDMLKLAYKAAGLEYKDLNNGDMDSEEVDSTHTTSPVIAFRGYPR